MKRFIIRHLVTNEIRVMKTVYTYSKGEIVHPLDFANSISRDHDNDWEVVMRLKDSRE